MDKGCANTTAEEIVKGQAVQADKIASKCQTKLSAIRKFAQLPRSLSAADSKHVTNENNTTNGTALLPQGITPVVQAVLLTRVSPSPP